jgi:hypothetical protein
MKQKLEQLAQQHTITMCCECKGIKFDDHTWIYENEAHDKGMHKHYTELILSKTKARKVSHGYCPPCYTIAVQEQYKQRVKLVARKF